MAGDDRAAMVGHEPQTARPPGQVMDTHQVLVTHKDAQAVAARALPTATFSSATGPGEPAPLRSPRRGPHIPKPCTGIHLRPAQPARRDPRPRRGPHIPAWSAGVPLGPAEIARRSPGP
ncbi:hypothetical protein [Streptomyces sp. AC550_RSS872]|uniref:hypothetical protein n=1 Tax=Streptomyces sp. AC550_RSS872 TaxID=2823689 RepID=UPI001C25B381|nr:hypothetical protein [Streptomyces sp. AC550_RSS872]